MLVLAEGLRVESIGQQGYQLIFQGNENSKKRLIAWLIASEDFLDSASVEMIGRGIVDCMQIVNNGYAFTLISQRQDWMIAGSKHLSLAIGLGQEKNYVAFEVPDLLAYTQQCTLINNGEIAIITSSKVFFMDVHGQIINKAIFQIFWDENLKKDGFEHFMLKEIHQQPQVFQTSLSGRLVKQKVEIESLNLSPKTIQAWRRMTIIACGTSYHAGLIGKAIFENLLGIPVEVEVASEFAYRKPLVDQSTLIMAISQSGETADTLGAVRKAKKKGAQVLALTNVLQSSIGHEADYNVYIWAGPEIAIASTKAFTATLLSQYLLAIYMAQVSKRIEDDKVRFLVEQLMYLPVLSTNILAHKEQYQRIAQQYYQEKNAYFIGRGLDWVLSLEGALKLKETSYIHAEGYPAGEFKHGSLALITQETLMIALIVQQEAYARTLANIKEYQNRGAHILAIALEGDQQIKEYAQQVIYLPCLDNFLMPILTILPLQLLAYYISNKKGCSIDQPRNLVKSIRVE